MHHFVATFALVSSTATALVGCSGGSDPKPSNNAGSERAKDSGSSDASGDFGPGCKAYLGCCDEIAESQPSLGRTCDQTRKSIDFAIDKGESTSVYESVCAQALSAVQGAGYCLGARELGPECKAYFRCCDEVAKSQPSLAPACDQMRKAIDDAVAKGASTSTYESNCTQGLSTMQSIGHCK